MKILTKEVEEAFAKQGPTGEKSAKDIMIVVKLFNPSGAGTWYLYEKEDEEFYWGYVNLGDTSCAECGIVCMSELMAFRGLFDLGIERDKFFKPLSVSLEEVIKRDNEGRPL